MGEANARQLERMLSVLFNTEFPEIPPTEVEFEIKAAALRNSLSSMYPVSDEKFSAIKRTLMSNIVVRMDIGIVITDKQPHKSWLPARRASLDFFFWNRYKRYLEEVKNWNSRVTGNLERVADEIVDLLGDPSSDTQFQRRGLVLGDVQSGKTANYTAICNKAADAGYRVIIVLTGMLENLRQQTQQRLDAEFSGRLSQYLLDPKRDIANIPVGVGKFGQTQRIETFTSVLKDFDKNILKALNLSLHSVKSTVLFVVKKNKSNLNNLIRWLQSNNADARGAINLPMLLIDDEADNASVNTNKEDVNPTAINDAIRRLLKLFRQASYLGITATPYANIFINPETSDEMRHDDLFPRNFIYSLEPPTNYIGANSIFGEDASFRCALEELSPTEMEGFFPFTHKKDHPVSELPPSMKEAMAYFLLVNGILDMRGNRTAHRTMMIHVSRFTNVQNQIRDLANAWVIQMRSELQNYAGLVEAESSMRPDIAYLKTVWDKHRLAEKVQRQGQTVSWHQFLSQFLFKAVAPIDVRAVNQQSGSTALDYFNHRDDGLRVIAVGGNSLSRGLTLEGLCVSYFYRKSQMYDTLLQMGRWFGYRPDYDDIFKIWISVEAIDWYGYITAAADELKREIAKMKNADLTPMEFGLKVRQDPASLIVTARNKMRAATPVSRPVTISGRLLESPRLKPDKAALASNEKTFKDFVKGLATFGQHRPQEGAQYFWKKVPKEEVEQLLRDFKTHSWHLSFQGCAIADFIRDSDAVAEWDVIIAEGASVKEYVLTCGDDTLRIRPEKRSITATKDQISISGTKVRVGKGGATRLGLTVVQRKDAEAKFKSTHPNKANINFPDSAYLDVQRPPILMLHIIEVDKTIDSNGKARSQISEGCEVPDYLFALGVGIPSIGEEKIANYMVNMVELRNYIDSAEDVEE